MSVPRDLALSIKSGYRFQWEKAQDAYVLLYPEGMISLGASSAEILKCCNGSSNVDEIIEQLGRQFPGADLESDVMEFLETAFKKGWICAG